LIKINKQLRKNMIICQG